VAVAPTLLWIKSDIVPYTPFSGADECSLGTLPKTLTHITSTEKYIIQCFTYIQLRRQFNLTFRTLSIINVNVLIVFGNIIFHRRFQKDSANKYSLHKSIHNRTYINGPQSFIQQKQTNNIWIQTRAQQKYINKLWSKINRYNTTTWHHIAQQHMIPQHNNSPCPPPATWAILQKTQTWWRVSREIWSVSKQRC